jgi:hypothetical protein
VSGLHRDGVVAESGVDVRVELHGHPLCRLVPYRGLIHVQVGGATTWESRVRDEAGYLDALDRIVTAFLRVVATEGAPPPQPQSC